MIGVLISEVGNCNLLRSRLYFSGLYDYQRPHNGSIKSFQEAMSASIDDTLGVSLIGMGLLNVLYGLTCAQTFYYFQWHSKGDRVWIRVTAASLWVVNTAHVAFVMHMQYYYLISSFGKPSMLEHDIWSLSASGLALGLISCQVYMYFTECSHRSS